MCNRNYRGHRGHHGWQHHPMYKHWKHQKMQNRWNYPPVNIQELDDRFEINVYASGFTKEEIQIKVSNNILYIHGDKPEDNLKQHWKRQEFHHTKFERRFELSEKVDQEKITARYEAGVLIVSLLKKPGFETVHQDITID